MHKSFLNKIFISSYTLLCLTSYVASAKDVNHSIIKTAKSKAMNALMNDGDIDEEIQHYDLVIDYVKKDYGVVKTSDASKPIGLYLKNDKGNSVDEIKFPGPTLTFEEGQIAEIKVINNLDEETSVHWHGLILPNDQDGVPHITTPSIPAHTEYTYKFPIKQSGTYWYHSHSSLQEQRGLFGSIVILPAIDPMASGHHHEHFDFDRVIDFSDYVKRDPVEILKNLKTNSETEPRIKGTERTLAKDIQANTLKQRLSCEIERMPPMDLADVAIDAILANGMKDGNIATSSSRSEKVKLRLINSSASSILRIQFGNNRSFRIVASDGLDITPIDVSHIMMGVGETYDVIVDTATDKQIEFRATVFDTKSTYFASAWIGPKDTEREAATGYAELNPYEHQMADTVYDQIRSVKSVNDKYKWADNAHITEFNMTLTGDMVNRYVWSMDNSKVFGDTKPFKIKKGDHVRVILTNSTMMFHPIHLHGHFFSVTQLEGPHESCAGETMANHGGHEGHGSHGNHGGEHGGHEDHGGGSGGGHEGHGNHPVDASDALWKHTMIMAPHSKYMIEFNASESKNWLFHCHNMYHMATGMSVMFAYTTDDNSEYPLSPMDPNNANHSNMPNMSPENIIKMHDEMSGKDGGYYSFDTNIMSNHGEGKAKMNINDKWGMEFIGKYNPNDGEHRERGEILYYPDQTSGVALYGATEESTGAKGVYGAAGIKFKAPLLIDTQIGYGTKGIDACVAKDVPLVGNVYAFGDWCLEGSKQYYNTGVGYRLTNPANSNIGVDATGGLNEDGPYIGIKVHGSGKAPDATHLFDDLIPSK